MIDEKIKEKRIIHITDEKPPINMEEVVPIIEPTPILVPNVKNNDVLSLLNSSFILILKFLNFNLILKYTAIINKYIVKIIHILNNIFN